ncbi:hypothetical protein TNCV_5024171 [Trichonephila clavipes]|nr:hypothetical protein TNCV_5024171 [Trichonephila clavipes]
MRVEAVGSLVVGAPDSRPEGLGSIPDATKYPPGTHGVVSPSIVPLGNFAELIRTIRRANSYYHLYCAQGQNDRRRSSPLPQWISWASICLRQTSGMSNNNRVRV